MAETQQPKPFDPSIDTSVSLHVPLTGTITSARAAIWGRGEDTSEIEASISVGASGEYFKGMISAVLPTADLIDGRREFALLNAASTAVNDDMVTLTEEIVEGVRTRTRDSAAYLTLGGLATAIASGGIMHTAENGVDTVPLMIFAGLGISGLASMINGIRKGIGRKNGYTLSTDLTRLEFLTLRHATLQELRAAAKLTPKVTIRRRAEPDGADALTTE